MSIMKQLTKDEAQAVLQGQPLPQPGYMRAAKLSDCALGWPAGQLGWVRHLPCSRLFLFEAVESFAAGTAPGTLRRMLT